MQWLTLTRKHQPYKLIGREGEQLTAAAATTDPGRLLTQKMLEQGLDAPPVMYIDADLNAYTARMVTKEAAAERAASIQVVSSTQPTSIQQQQKSLP